ncbi:tRNA (guanine(10)-N2)-methyltransferase [Paramyrothecium foliicola]|nr:tRNA (guanine(10)-N2)-methyltransferase [Paramyrothecium foliicola]
MDFIIKFAQVHETFRLPEIQALAVVEDVDLTVLAYDNSSPFCLVRLPSVEAARKLIRRSILAQSIHELWGTGASLDELHQDVRKRSESLWEEYTDVSFRFDIDSHQGSRPSSKRLSIINTFHFLPFKGPIRMTTPDEVFTIFELWPWNSVPMGVEHPTSMYLGRFLGNSSRDLVIKYDLKKRRYISTTSMDAELSLITANIALAAPGKLFYDPFVGTGSFPIACAHFGAIPWGSDLDGRSIRGNGDGKDLLSNFKQYDLATSLGGVFAADLTNSPIRTHRRTWDGIVCDPPYGVREGLKVLGIKDPAKSTWLIEKGIRCGMLPDYVPPKKPYSFLAMLDNILIFAADTLVDNGRLSFWMPTANDEQLEIPIPTHPCLEIVSICLQVFNKWSRRLITYRRLPDEQVSRSDLDAYKARQGTGSTADELNPFRRGYFRKFETDE